MSITRGMLIQVQYTRTESNRSKVDESTRIRLGVLDNPRNACAISRAIIQLGEKPQSKDENQQQTQLAYDVESGNRTWATFVGGECSHHCAIPADRGLNIQRLPLFRGIVYFFPQTTYVTTPRPPTLLALNYQICPLVVSQWTRHLHPIESVWVEKPRCVKFSSILSAF